MTETITGNPDRTATFLEHLKRRGAAYRAEVGSVDDPRYAAARQALTESYLRDGTVRKSDLVDGQIPDHYRAQSVPVFVESNDELAVAARFVLPTQEGLTSLPAKLYEPGIYPAVRAILEESHAEVPGSIAELGALVRTIKSGPAALFPLVEELVRYSMASGIRLWSIGLKPKSLAFAQVAGFAMIPLGTEVWYEGLHKPSLPFVVDVELLDQTFFRRKTGMAQAAIRSLY